MTSRSLASAFVLLLGSVAGISTAAAQSLDFQNYNVIVFGDLNTNSDIEGRTFVGNNFTGTNSATIGNRLQSVASNDRAFVVGNDLVAGNALHLQGGSLYIDGNANGRVTTRPVVADHSIDAALAGIKSYAEAQSQSLMSMASDSIVTLPSGGQPGPLKFFATGGLDGLAVFNVNAAQIFNNNFVQQMELILDANTTDVLINVTGDVNWVGGANMVGNFTSNYWQAHTLWNFHDATLVDLNAHQFNGGILAPKAHVQLDGGSIDGLVVADKLTATAEIHLPDSNASLTAFSGFTAPVPEPGSAIFLLAAGGLLFIMRNRRLMA
ncbi:MAG: choice-of-anchor A family protein [Prosthecobacter sp.]